ncbi:hypothetical protein B0A50_02790 [Salinomyces thailandicus]|uniref:Large ribosomal subunit protein mL44 n=1 Tax=Salinomyces thailandicus TaxID=706561 RepID=A0A4U0U4N0_9PEZI|nr:hypothetical protein B0A50_02790 [Salinomyces thailandica]
MLESRFLGVKTNIIATLPQLLPSSPARLTSTSAYSIARMKRVRLDRWASQFQIQPPRNPRLHLQPSTCLFSQDSRAPRREWQQRHYHIQHRWQNEKRPAGSRRKASSTSATQADDATPEPPIPAAAASENSARAAPSYTSTLRKVTHSAKLSALHARLSLPSKLPLQTLATCLIDPSADPRPGYNNASFAVVGQDLLGYYTSEYLICRYPRLPMPVLFAAQYAYAGNATLGAMRSEWGVEAAAAPGPEVDPGLLQLKRKTPGNAILEGDTRRLKDMPLARRLGSSRRNDMWHYRRGMSSRIVFDDEFGDLLSGLPPADAQPYPGAAISEPTEGSTKDVEESLQDESDLTRAAEEQLPTISDPEPVTVDEASASFIRALAGALYLHAGSAAAKSFHKDHFLSRQLQLHTLFHFTHPTRDLSRLCAREGFEPPVARLISETGRLSRTPVFVVGVYSGNDKLGEGAGSSLNEGRVRAAAAALRSWYLYSPPESEVVLPSEVEGAVSGAKGKKKWKPQMVDMGEIIT